MADPVADPDVLVLAHDVVIAIVDGVPLSGRFRGEKDSMLPVVTSTTLAHLYRWVAGDVPGTVADILDRERRAQHLRDRVGVLPDVATSSHRLDELREIFSETPGGGRAGASTDELAVVETCIVRGLRLATRGDWATTEAASRAGLVLDPFDPDPAGEPGSRGGD